MFFLTIWVILLCFIIFRCYGEIWKTLSERRARPWEIILKILFIIMIMPLHIHHLLHLYQTGIRTFRISIVRSSPIQPRPCANGFFGISLHKISAERKKIPRFSWTQDCNYEHYIQVRYWVVCQCDFKVGVQTWEVYSVWRRIFWNRIETYKNGNVATYITTSKLDVWAAPRVFDLVVLDSHNFINN